MDPNLGIAEHILSMARRWLTVFFSCITLLSACKTEPNACDSDCGKFWELFILAVAPGTIVVNNTTASTKTVGLNFGCSGRLIPSVAVAAGQGAYFSAHFVSLGLDGDGDGRADASNSMDACVNYTFPPFLAGKSRYDCNISGTNTLTCQ